MAAAAGWAAVPTPTARDLGDNLQIVLLNSPALRLGSNKLITTIHPSHRRSIRVGERGKGIQRKRERGAKGCREKKMEANPKRVTEKNRSRDK